MSPNHVVRHEAERLLKLYPLRAADALQLAAALVASDYEPRTLPFRTSDKRLAEAATGEVFKVE